LRQFFRNLETRGQFLTTWVQFPSRGELSPQGWTLSPSGNAPLHSPPGVNMY
jgi:hypothetical protein